MDGSAKQLDKKGIDYDKLENAFLRIQDCDKAQQIADGFAKQRWEKLLAAFAVDEQFADCETSLCQAGINEDLILVLIVKVPFIIFVRKTEPHHPAPKKILLFYKHYTR